jgi:hypothetical protein
MKTNRDGITQTTNYGSRNPHQYPITTVDYAMVPTCGLTPKKASAIRQFLNRATRAQHVGLLPGQLAPGDLPLTKRQLTQTRRAATEVSAKSCTQPAKHPTSHPTGNVPPPPPGGRSGGPPGGGSGGPPDAGPSDAPGVTPGDVSGSSSGASSSAYAPSTSSAPSATSPPPSPAPSSTAAAFGFKHSDSGIDTGLVLPLALLLAALLFVGGPVGYVLAKNGTGARALSQLRRGLRR